MDKQVWHPKRGSYYDVLGDGKVQISTATKLVLHEGDKLTVYKGQDGKLWLRTPQEFNDGRFIEV